MGSRSFNTFDDVDAWVNLASDSMIDSFTLDDSQSPMVGYWANDLDDEALSITYAMENGEPMVSPELSGLAVRISELESALSMIQANQIQIEIPWTQTRIPRRTWVSIPSLSISVSAQLAGTWVWAANVNDTLDGRAIGIRLKKNGDVITTMSVDGSSSTGDSGVAVSDIVTASEGDVISVEVIHNIATTRDLFGSVRAVKQFGLID